MSVFIKAVWLGAWVQCLVITWFCDRKWRPPNSPSKNIMQADPEVGWDARGDASNFMWIPYEEGRRLRKCPFGCNFGLSDRVYHCSRLRRCLPVYDHFCDYLKVAVYLRTIKPYLYVLLFLALDSVFSSAISLFAVARYKVLYVPFAGSVIMGAIMVVMVLIMCTMRKFYLLLFRNSVVIESKYCNQLRRFHFAFKYNEGGEWRLRLSTFDGQDPWDLGTVENLHHVLGRHWWQWLLFWWQPERVSRYGRYAGQDLPFADFINTYRSDLLMAPFNSVAVVDDFGLSSIHEQGSSSRQQSRPSVNSRREQQRSSAVSRHRSMQGSEESAFNRRSVQRSSGSSAPHAEEPARPVRDRRRRFELTSTTQ
ncbi:hypothetical protein F5B20DRAFT_498080 [Whalleya microplaca]|nr:hypothetical protein F5B20DRAFT_498080 [Whalleya microplaca]